MCTRQFRKVIWDMINTLFPTLQLSNLLLLLFFGTRKHHTSMASRAILSDFFEEQLTQTTNNTFRDCRVYFFRQPFLKQLYPGCIQILLTGLPQGTLKFIKPGSHMPPKNPRHSYRYCLRYYSNIRGGRRHKCRRQQETSQVVNGSYVAGRLGGIWEPAFFSVKK